MIEDKKECIYDCTKDEVYKYLYNGQCVKECPEGSYLYNYICRVDKNTLVVGVRTFYSEGNVVEEIGNLVESYSTEFNYTNNYISMYENGNYSIAIYKNVSCLSELEIDMPIIDFQNCYKKIQEVYNITQELIIVLVDKLEQDNPNTSYSIYHPISGEKLDAARICQNETILITENHFFVKDDPDYELKQSLIAQNINLFD